MKNFTQEEILKFVQNFHLVHGYTTQHTFTPNGRVFFTGKHPLSLVLLREDYVPRFIDKEKTGYVMHSNFSWNDKQKYYFLPNFIDSSLYSGSVEQEYYLNYWYTYSQQYADNYINKENIINYTEIQEKISDQLLFIAIQLWNQITLQSDDGQHFDNCLNKKFWNSYHCAQNFTKFTYPDTEKNMTTNEFEKCIIDSFENIDDIITFENYMLSVPTDILYSIKTEKIFWLKILKKLVPKFSLKKPTPIIQSYIDRLTKYPNEYVKETLAMLDIIEYCSYEVTKDFYHHILKETNKKQIANRINKYISKFE